MEWITVLTTTITTVFLDCSVVYLARMVICTPLGIWYGISEVKGRDREGTYMHAG